MFKKMTLKSKLLLSFLLVGIIPFAIVSIFTLWQASDALSHAAFNELQAVRDIKKQQVELYFQERRGDMSVLVETVKNFRLQATNELEAIHSIKKKQLSDYFQSLKADLTTLASNNTVQFSMFRIGDAFKKDGQKVGGNNWNTAVAKYDSWFKKYVQAHGYYDVFLIASDGYIVYTSARESDLGQNVLRGQLRDSGLGACVQKALSSRKIEFADFAPYAPSGNKPEAFVTKTIQKDSNVLGVLALQIDTSQVNAIMQERHGMGKTGETYLVGPDKRMRSDSYLNPQSHSIEASFAGTIDKNGIDTEVVREALAGKNGVKATVGYRGEVVLSVYAPLKIFDVTWAILADIDVAEALNPVDEQGQAFFAYYKEAYGYYDIFLILPSGYCFYTVEREADYQSNLLTGKYRNSGLGKLVRQVIASKQFAMADFAPYAPSNNEAAAFVAQPQIDEQGAVEVVIALQLPLKDINDIMQQRSGMGKTGETYLVGSDKLMRSDSYLDPTYHSVQASFANPNKGSVDTEAVREALVDKIDTKIIVDYLGNSVLSAYAPVKVYNNKWVIVAEVDETEAFAAVTVIEWAMLIIAIIGLAAIVTFALVLSNSISNPITRVVSGLSSASDQIASASQQMSTSSQQVSEGASEQASTLEEVSSSLEEMTSMTQQNADNAAEAEKLSTTAKSSAEGGNSQMNSLNDSMEEIAVGANEMQKIIGNIEEIASQTNMLALNAAVEAARAGEHGRGFAVVAEEVRNLALKSAEFAKSTAALVLDSTQQIGDGRDVAKKTVELFNEILDGSTKVNELISEVTAASQEQSRGLNQVTQSVTELDKVVQSNAATAEEAASVSEELSSQAGSLQSMVDTLSAIIGIRSSNGFGNGPGAHLHKTAKQFTPHQPANMNRGVKNDHIPAKPEEVIPLNEEEFKDF